MQSFYDVAIISDCIYTDRPAHQSLAGKGVVLQLTQYGPATEMPALSQYGSMHACKVWLALLHAHP